jgi:hypothetical protein
VKKILKKNLVKSEFTRFVSLIDAVITLTIVRIIKNIFKLQKHFRNIKIVTITIFEQTMILKYFKIIKFQSHLQ